MQDLVVMAGLTLTCSMWDLVPDQESNPGLPALGGQRLSHWTTRMSLYSFLNQVVR